VAGILKTNIVSSDYLKILSYTELYGFFSERMNTIPTGISSNNTYLLSDGTIHYHTANSEANCNVSLNGFTDVSVGNSASMAVIITNNVFKRYVSTVKIDDTASGVTVKWAGESSPSAGSANTDIYTFNVLKTANSTYTVFANKSSFG
jgi:hypothetical protein